MKSFDGRNNVKIYNLSSGKNLPDWLTEYKRRRLQNRDIDIRRRIEIIQDFTMPDVSSCIEVSEDMQYILTAGLYKPTLKCFEVSALSQKFERHFDREVIAFRILSDDYSKLVFLQADRYLEFHNQGGRWFEKRIPKLGRDLAYHYPSCDLYITAAGSEIYRLNLQQGKFLNSLQSKSESLTKCLFNPVHYLFTCGTEDGIIECWDPRSRHRVGSLDCAFHMISGNMPIAQYKSSSQFAITSLAYNDSLTLGVGTYTGQVILYDIRSSKPLLIKDHMDGYPIKSLEFHSGHSTYEMVLSMSSRALKIWEKNTARMHTSIESSVKFNDLSCIPQSGMIFLATESPKMEIYFLPSLGPAPRWCAHLDALIEELEEEEAPAAYDDYKFVTEKELVEIGLDSLIGTSILRAVMHGYYIDNRLYKKAQLASNALDKNYLLKKKVQQKIAEQNERKIILPEKLQKKIPDINRESFMLLKEKAQKHAGVKSDAAKNLLEDPRFESMFTRVEFTVNKEEKIYNVVQPRKHKAVLENVDSDSESDSQQLQNPWASDGSSDSDSILSKESEDEEEDEPSKPKKKVRRKTMSDIVPETKPAAPVNSNSASKKKVEFISGDTIDEIQPTWIERKELPLSERLLEEAGHDDETIHRAGQMKVHFSNRKAAKFEKLRKRQKEHELERKKVVRRTTHLKGQSSFK